ncbi:MAG: flippase-like domain-containing protein [Pirellulales bacterium]|nr:flippase-like domain-containing protein [Pirellulales bacterium]
MKRLLATLVKIGISVAIIGYLVWQARQDDAFTILRDQPKRWGMLVIAWLFCAGAVLTTIVRWHFLVRALEIPSRLRNSLRIGFLGYMFNLAPLGLLGGDAIKVVMLAREHKNTKSKSIASVVVDRLIGLYMLFVVAAIAILVTGFWRAENATDKAAIANICLATFLAAVVGTLGIGALMIPAVSDGKLVRAIERLPRLGHPIKSLIDALRMYRRRPGVLLAAALMSVIVHSCFATGIYFIASGLFTNVHSLGDHLVMSPLSMATGVLPLPFGPFEWVLNDLYAWVRAGGVIIPGGQGFVVALGYRVITVLIAAIGAGYYIGARQELAQSIQQADEDESAVVGPTIAMTEKCQSASAA